MRSLAALLAFLGGSAHAATLSGEVIDARGHWTADGSRIVTEATVRTANGDVVVSQLGGTADGLGMITMPGPPILQVGMQVDLVVHADFDLAMQAYTVVDDVRVLFAPSDPVGFVRTGPTKSGHYLYW